MKVTVICLECAKTWKVSVDALTSGDLRCPKCRGYDVDLT